MDRGIKEFGDLERTGFTIFSRTGERESLPPSVVSRLPPLHFPVMMDSLAILHGFQVLECAMLLCASGHGKWGRGSCLYTYFSNLVSLFVLCNILKFTFVNSFLYLIGELGPLFAAGPLSPPPIPIVCVPSSLPLFERLEGRACVCICVGMLVSERPKRKVAFIFD